MKTLISLALSRIRYGRRRCIIQSLSAFVSSLTISFFVCLQSSVIELGTRHPTFGIDTSDAESVLTVDSIRKFFQSITTGIAILSGVMTALLVIMLYIFVKMRSEDNKHFMATLTSVGASRFEKSCVSVAESMILFALPLLVGAIVGTLPAYLFSLGLGSLFSLDFSPSLIGFFASLLIVLLLVVAVALLSFVEPRLGSSVIESLKSHNKRETSYSHSYRKSYTFRKMPIEKRIAKKSVDYHRASYFRITVAATVCALYPVLSLLFFVLVGQVKISDYTPSYGIDVNALVSLFANRISILTLVLLVLLTALGVAQLYTMIKIQNEVRSSTLKLYESVGMTKEKTRRVLLYEYRTVFFRAAVSVIFLILLLLFGFDSLV